MADIAKLFEYDEFLIDEKVQILKFSGEYKIYNIDGVQIGLVKQNLSSAEKVLRLLLNGGLLGFEFDIMDTNGIVLVKIKRGITLFMSNITVLDGSGRLIGTIKQKFKLFKPEFYINDAEGNQIGKIAGDWKAWNFQISDNNNNDIGTISKKWAGMKELFTSADKYHVKINESYAEDLNKVNILSAAITIDMVLKESK